MITETPTPVHQALTASLLPGNWKQRFFSIWVGQAFSLVGSALTQFVLLWWITNTTNSAGALAIAGAMALLPQALLGPLGGTIADRLSRRAIMIVADTISATCILVIIWLFSSDQIQLWHVYALMFIRSSMQAFQTPAASASTSMLVPIEWLPRVGGLNQTLQGIMTIAAAPLGALALAFFPLQYALAIDVVTALIGITPLLIFKIPQARRAASQYASVWADFKEGIQVVRQRRGLAILYGLIALVVMTVLPTFTITPLLVKNHFNGGVNEVALIETLGGVGMILGGVLISLIAFKKRQVATILISFAISCGTVALTALAPSNMLLLGAFWWFISGVSFSTGNAPMMALIQMQIPNQLQGRAIGLLNTIMGIAGPIGLVLAAPLGEALGVIGVFVVGGTLSAVISLLGFFSPDLMRLESAHDPTREHADRSLAS